MSYHQLTQTNRIEIGALYRSGLSLRAIAYHIGCHHSTISRELQRHKWHNPSGYHAGQARIELAHKRFRANQHHRKLPINETLVALVTTKLKLNWSPEQIAGWLKLTGNAVYACAQTIYDWVYTSARHLIEHLHCRKGMYRRTRENTLRKAFRDKQKEARRISARPARVLKRKSYGHWERDTIVGKAHKGAIVTLVERKSGYLLATKLMRGSAEGFEDAVVAGFTELKTSYCKTLTLDNGTEMSNYEAIERATGMHVYFANPYHSWERGTNENTNGLLRFYFPKGTDLTKITQEQLDTAIQEINTRPRKRLGYRKPEQMLKRCGAFRTRI